MLKNKIVRLAIGIVAALTISPIAIAATSSSETETTYIQGAISVDEAVEMEKSVIFDASQSFLPDKTREITYEWDFGDGNRDEGVEVLHAYTEPGQYTITLSISDGDETSTVEESIFVYRKLIFMLTDQTEAKERIEAMGEYAGNQDVYIKLIDSYGSSTEFISEEVLNKKLSEQSKILQKAQEVVIWTKDNAGMNALSRFVQNNTEDNSISLSQKTIVVITENLSSTSTRIQRQFELINPEAIVVSQEASIYLLIESEDSEEFLNIAKNKGYEFELINDHTGKLRPWNFMSYFVNFLVNKGVPDNTIALLLLLPVIATVVVVMKQVVGVTTFGVYTPSIITLSFLVIGVYAGLLTLAAAIIMGTIARPLLKRFRMLFIPRMAIVITAVSLLLFLILIFSTYLGLFDAEFLSIAIFPMLILSTLVEKFISVKTEKGLSSAVILMTETVVVAIIAYIIAGGEVNIGFATLKLDFVKNIMMSYPEIILLLLIINILLGKWSGVRLLEFIRFREVLRHIEE